MNGRHSPPWLVDNSLSCIFLGSERRLDSKISSCGFWSYFTLRQKGFWDPDSVLCFVTGFQLHNGKRKKTYCFIALLILRSARTPGLLFIPAQVWISVIFQSLWFIVIVRLIKVLFENLYMWNAYLYKGDSYLCTKPFITFEVQGPCDHKPN